jgi:hypothetical protein
VNVDADRGNNNGGEESLADVLSAIRDLVSAETKARETRTPDNDDGVIMLTPAMRVEVPAIRRHSGEVLSEGLGADSDRKSGAPILDEEALRGVVNDIVREELQGELGDRISRNLRKLIRQEIRQLIEVKRDD